MTCPPAPTKLRVLCLHGYQQSAEVFRNRLGSMRKALKSKAEFIFLDAPFLAAVEAGQGAAASEEPAPGRAGRTWWQWLDLEPGTRPSRAAHYTGWEASQAAIAAALKEHAPVDVLLGFSQGATAAALFLAHEAAAPAADSAAASLLLAVVIGGFLPRDGEYAGVITAARPSLPSLHVSGADDDVVPEERGRALFEAFQGAAWHQHAGGHMVPTCSGEFKAVLADAFAAAAAARPP